MEGLNDGLHNILDRHLRAYRLAVTVELLRKKFDLPKTGDSRLSCYELRRLAALRGSDACVVE